MAIGDDFSISPEGDIRHTSGTTNYTVLQLHRWLQDLADDASFSGNDVLDITDDTPSDRSTDNIITLINGYNIDDTAAQYLYGGSITQDDGDTVYSGLRVLGAVNDSSTQLMVIQDNGLYQFTTTPAAPFWGDQSSGGYNGNAASGVLMRCLIKSRQNGADIDGKRIRVQARQWGDTYDFFNVTLGQGESVAAIGTTPDPQNSTAVGTVGGWAGGDIPTNVEGFQLIDLNNGSGNREYYSQWTFNTNAAGLKAIWEWGKYITRNGTSNSLYGVNGELYLGITHSFTYDNETGAFVENDIVAWGTQITYDNLSGSFTLDEYVTIGTNGAAGKLVYDNASNEIIVALENTSITISDGDVITGISSGATADVNVTVVDNDKLGGTGLLLALDDDGTTGNFYIQVLTGAAPSDNQFVVDRSTQEFVQVNGTPTSRTVPKVFLGSYVGTMIGAYGVGIDPDDLTASDTIEDLSGTTQTPPNNVTFNVNGVVSGEDYVLVGPYNSDTAPNGDPKPDENQLTGATGSNASGAGTWVVNETIPSDTPSSGTVRVFNGQSFDKVAYTSYTGSTFTLSGTLPNAGASHTLSFTGASGSFTVGETLTFGGGGTAELLYVNEVTASTGTMVIRMLTGSDPIDTDSITGGTSLETATVSGAPVDAGGFISYIDKLATGTTESFTTIFSSTRSLIIRVRDGASTPIKTFVTLGSLTSNGGSSTVIRTTDA